jgi:(p)ppGpp synthase/HD superfamily hydrolase
MRSETRDGSKYSERIDTALRVAAAAHHEDVRKGTAVPYVMHPFHVGLILDRHGFAEDVVIAGVLHDVLEDPDYAAESVQSRLRAVCPPLAEAPVEGHGFKDAFIAHLQKAFGTAALELVEHVSERKLDESGAKRPWRARKEDQLASLVSASEGVCALKAADCLHNLHALTRDVRANGAGTMDRFNASSEETVWYHQSVADAVAARLGADQPLVVELRAVLDGFERALAGP